jgi:transcriptional regulator with AAA-type ATPase domain
LPQLEFERDGKRLFVHPLRGRVIVGRSDVCDIALPGQHVSREHLVVREHEGRWVVRDRSSNGIRVNGQEQSEAVLTAGDQIAVGPYLIRFSTGGTAAMAAATANRLRWKGQVEELVEVVAGRVATTTQAQLRFTQGGLAGELLALKHPRVTLGGPGCDVVLGPDLPKPAVLLRVVRGRVSIEPGELRPELAGQMVRELTPVFPGEAVTFLGQRFIVETVTAQRDSIRGSFGNMVGQSVAMQGVFGMLTRVAQHDFCVLLTGESGTGKELAARGVHGESARMDHPFVAVNCAALSDTLFESELFGHRKGAFTGAEDDYDGAFVQAAGGVLFLDEVGELRLESQAKLLRALESREVRPLGGTETLFPDVRVIAATNRDLLQMCTAGTFRRDLFFRLSVLAVRLPALRSRPEDVVPLATTLLQRHHPGATLSATAQQALVGYAWPGNGRELRNVLTRGVVMHGPHLTANTLEFQAGAFRVATARPEDSASQTQDRARLIEALARHEGNRSATARYLGIPRSSLLYKLRRFGL